MSIEKEIEELKIINQQMAEKIKKLESQNKKEKEKELDKYKLPRVENQKYYHIAKFTLGIDINSTIDYQNNDFDNLNYEQYNYFTDKEKAQQYANHIKLELELLQIRDIIRDGWTPVWNNIEHKYFVFFRNGNIYIDCHFSSYRPLTFQSKEKANKFIELVGKEKIKQYLSFL